MNKTTEHIKNVCKIGQKNLSCRYLIITGRGFECMKNTDMKGYLDSRVAMETMVARGDNCEGKTVEFLNNVKTNTR